MRELLVLQHTESEFLGLMEDHLEGRGIRFRYVRPFAAGTRVPATAFGADGLLLLGGGPWRAVAAPTLPGVVEELRLVRDALQRRRPVIGIGLGCQLLCLAAGGGVVEAALDFSLGEARRVTGAALGGYLPGRMPIFRFMRDRPVPPAEAEVLALDELGHPALLRIAGNCLGFSFHPGCKTAMVEDLLMEIAAGDFGAGEFGGGPADPLPALTALRTAQQAIADALVPLMTGVVAATGLMQEYDARELAMRRSIAIERDQR